MSCEIKFRSSIAELNKVKRILFPSLDAGDEDDNWSTDDWTWKSDFEDAIETNDKNSDWIQSCLITSSHQSEVLVIAHQDRYVVLSSKWERRNQKEFHKFHVTYPTSNSSSDGLGENITAVSCIPIKSLQKSSPGMPDWICIVLGFNSGFVRMYTVDGNLLMTEAFHDEPVHQLNFHSSLMNPAKQELSVLYQKICVIIEGLGLFNSLRACRSQIAKGRALYGAGDLHSQHPQLHYKKLSLQEQNKINDCFVLGTSAPTQFDHLVTASVAGGFQARYNNAPPVSTGIFSLGSIPYCAWHYAVEGSAAPLLSDVAYALASKVTSKIFSKTSGWLGWGGAAAKSEAGQSKPKEKQVIEPATPVYPRYGLADALREALSVSVSPNERLAALTDTLGRVILVDLFRGTAVRMWKGYRDSQCGWVTAWEETSPPNCSGSDPSSSRTVAFLVIYITKRGILEIWTPQQGTRVAAFNCSKGAKLLDTSMGTDKDQPQCCLLCSDGRIDEVVVPFHCALKGDSSQKARDLHVLQQLRTELLHDANPASFNLLLDIRHASVVNQGLDLLLECRHLVDPDAFVKCLDSVVNQYSKAEALDAESRLLLSRCRLLSRLARLYIHLKAMQSQPPDYEAVVNASSVSLKEVATVLRLNHGEISRTVLRCPSVMPHPPDRASEPAIEIHKFLCFFELSAGHGSSDDCVRVKSSVCHDDRRALGTWIWGTPFSRNIDLLDELASVLKESSIAPEDLVAMLVSYWLHLNSPALPNILHFHKLLRMLCGFAAPENFNNTEASSPWWQNLRDILSKSSNLEQACCAALVVRSVMAEFEKQKISRLSESGKRADDSDVIMDDSMSDWEDMSIDMVTWNVLSKQFEDLSFLSRLIRYVPAKLRETQRLNLEILVEENVDTLEFSLASILQKGRGAVTELVARWLTQNLLDIDTVFGPAVREIKDDSDQSMTEMETEQAPEADKLSIGTSEEVAIIQDLFRDLSQHLPHSTQHDVVLLNVAIEYAAMWIRNPKHMKLLSRSFESVLPLRSNLLRHGICRTLWSMSILPIFQDLALLMDKTGRMPKNFSSRKINLPSPDQALPFLEITMKLLDTAITSAMSCEMEPPPFIRYDDIWPTCEGTTPMLEVAIRHRLINIDLVLLHHQLAQTLHLMASLEIKGTHAFSLFDQRVGRYAFFKDLHSYPPLPSQEADPTVVENRLQFLKQVISKAVEHMEHNQGLALDYINQAIKLGYEWRVDVDELRIKYVELLYLNQMDHLAHEVLPSIGSDEKLVPTLLEAARKRLKVILKQSDISALSPMTTDWLNGFTPDSESSVPLSDSTPTKTLAVLVECLRRIPSDGNNQFIANELHSLLITMQDSNP